MYYFVFICGILLLLIPNSKKTSVLYLSILGALSIFRFGVGADYFSYKYIYSQITPLWSFSLSGQRIDFLFEILMSIFKSLHLSYEYFVGFVALVNLYFLYKLVSNYSKNKVLSLFSFYTMFYFVWIFSAYRQGLVLSIGSYYLLECYSKKKDFMFIIIILILSQIHLSALYLLVLYFVAKRKFDLKKLVTIMSLLAVFFNLYWQLIIPFLKLFPTLYIRAYPYLYTNLDINTLAIKVLPRVSMLIFVLFFIDYEKLSEIERKIINLFTFSILSYVLMMQFDLIAARLSIYGFYYGVLIIPLFLTNLKYPIIHKLVLPSLIVFSGIYLYKELDALKAQSGIINKSQFLPYTNIFNRDRYEFENQFHHTQSDNWMGYTIADKKDKE